MNKTIIKLEKVIESYTAKADNISTDYGNANLTHRRAQQLAENQRKANGFLKIAEIAKQLVDAHNNGSIDPRLERISAGAEIAYLLTGSFPKEITAETPDWRIKELNTNTRIVKKLLITSECEFSNVYRLISELGTNAPKTGNSFSESAILLKYPGLRNIPGFFPTPEKVGKRVIELAEIDEGGAYDVWEPSAGFGSLVDLVRSTVADPAGTNITVCEQNTQLASILTEKGYNVAANDMYDITNIGSGFERIIMNPPFEKNQDSEHVQYCYKALRKRGILVSVMGLSWTFNNNAHCTAFRNWLELPEDWYDHFKLNGTYLHESHDKEVYIEMNSEGSFKSSFNTTAISTLILKIRRVE